MSRLEAILLLQIGQWLFTEAVGSVDLLNRSLKKPRMFQLQQHNGITRMLTRNKLVSNKLMSSASVPTQSGDDVKAPETDKLGDLDVLPIEVREHIYALALDIGRPVTIKNCCTPGKTPREVSRCSKHGSRVKANTGRFNMLYVCKGMRQEAMQVLFTKGSMLLHPDPFMEGYLKDCPRSNSPRRIDNFMQRDVQVAAMWNTISQFRSIKIEVSTMRVNIGHPTQFAERILAITSLLCNEETDPVEMAKQSRTLNIGGIFVHKMPFNMREAEFTSYDLVFDWLFTDYPEGSPDINSLAAEVMHRLHRMVAGIGKHSHHASWTILVNKKLRDNEEGGQQALEQFEHACDYHGVALVHAE